MCKSKADTNILNIIRLVSQLLGNIDASLSMWLFIMLYVYYNLHYSRTYDNQQSSDIFQPTLALNQQTMKFTQTNVLATHYQ